MRFSSLALALLLPVVVSAETTFDITLRPFLYELGFTPKYDSLVQPGDRLNFTLSIPFGDALANVYESTFEQPCVQKLGGFATGLHYGVSTFVQVLYTPMYFYSGTYATCRDEMLVYAAGASDDVFSQFLHNLISSPPPPP